MNQVRIAVIGEDHRLVAGEQAVEIAVAEAVRMLIAGLQRHQVDDVDDANSSSRAMLAQQIDGGQRFQGRDVAGAGHDDVGFAAVFSLPAQSQMPMPASQCVSPLRPWSAIAAPAACRRRSR